VIEDKFTSKTSSTLAGDEPFPAEEEFSFFDKNGVEVVVVKVVGVVEVVLVVV
tara:strand:- start:760 stop:918 length:159 start_codon:yes stop_codon:yes gene_type:complete